MRPHPARTSDPRRTGILAAVLAAILLAFAAAPAVCGRLPPSPSRAGIAALHAAMRRAKLAAQRSVPPWGGPPGAVWRDPYGGVLSLLRRDGPRLPLRSQARALARIADALYLYVRYGGPPTMRRFRGMAQSLLRRAVKICPRCGSAWAVLAYTELTLTSPQGEAALGRNLAMACRSNPVNPGAQYMRAQEIFGYHTRAGPKPGRNAPFGDVQFTSPRWARAYCYRALMCLASCRSHRTIGVFGPGSCKFYESFLLPELKYYEPKQLAEEEAGTWKPDPAADPWPPSATQPAKKTPTTRRAKPGAAAGDK